jgi:spermidine synthase
LKKWNLREQSTTPDGQELSLWEHDGQYVIRVGAAELMSTRRHASEEKLAELACAHLAKSKRTAVLIGGLGMGFTLKAALKALPSKGTRVITAEILPAIIAWNENPAYPLGEWAMTDPRVTIERHDVVTVIRESTAAFDAIILDIDNGPTAFTLRDNSRLYEAKGLEMIARALKPGGCAAIWSASPNPDFEKLVKHSSLTLEIQNSRAHITSGKWHTIYLARKA